MVLNLQASRDVAMPTWSRRAGGRHLALLVAGGLVLLAGTRAWALVFVATGDRFHNTSAPTGEYADSGWQWQGEWGSYTGTPIGTNWFLSAQHVGGLIGDELILNGQRYRTTAFFDDPESDLRLWRVCQPFPSFAPLASATQELGKVCVIFGRGASRGAEVTVTNAGVAQLRGWMWAPGPGKLHWGLNRVSGFESFGGSPGVLLWAAFDAAGGAEEAIAAVGDSSGGVFVSQNGRWELAGITYGVSGPFNYQPDGTAFNASLFDRRGLYQPGANGWVLVTGVVPQPGAFSASRVSVRRSWIESTMAANPAPATAVQVWAAPAPEGTYNPESATIDEGAKVIRVARPALTTFYRLSACDPVRVVSMNVAGDALLLGYE